MEMPVFQHRMPHCLQFTKNCQQTNGLRLSAYRCVSEGRRRCVINLYDVRATKFQDVCLVVFVGEMLGFVLKASVKSAHLQALLLQCCDVVEDTCIHTARTAKVLIAIQFPLCVWCALGTVYRHSRSQCDKFVVDAGHSR